MALRFASVYPRIVPSQYLDTSSIQVVLWPRQLSASAAGGSVRWELWLTRGQKWSTVRPVMRLSALPILLVTRDNYLQSGRVGEESHAVKTFRPMNVLSSR